MASETSELTGDEKPGQRWTMPDGRPIPPLHGGERAMLEGWLDWQRETLAVKCAGVDDEAARRATVEPSSMTLVGMVQHLAEVERNWFRRIVAGELDAPSVFPEGLENGFDISAGRGLGEAMAAWRAEIARGREIAAGRSLDDPCRFPPEDVAFLRSASCSLRWVLVHLIEEYARHNGHADLIRERLDGTTGT
jgi:uncharacterized damage-inducible protein DinB